jgi:hypothetical protein
MKEIAKALCEAQKEMGNAKKDSTNPFFKSKYADLNSVREACIPALNAHGIAVLQPTVHIDGKNFVKTVLLHESGQTFEALTEIIYNKPNDAQAQGSGISYARRYGLQSLCNVGAEDDDGQKAVEQPKKKAEPESPLAEEVIESLHAEFMKLWNEYRDLTSDKQAGQFHPENWTKRTLKAYQLAIPTIKEKILKELNAKQLQDK